MSSPSPDAESIAAAWHDRLQRAAATAWLEGELPQNDEQLISALAQFVTLTLDAGQSLLLVVPDDELLPALSNALDLALRPLCLVLPQPGFAARIAQRATLSLLKSRLARGGEDSHAAAWQAQRARLEAQAPAWQSALAWAASSDAQALDVEPLFPVSILPLRQALAGGEQRDVVLLVTVGGNEALAALRARGGRCLLLAGARPSGAMTIADADAQLASEQEMLAQQLSELELELATAQAELAEFTRRYAQMVGSRLTELDRIEARIAELLAERAPTDAPARGQAEQARARAEQSAEEQSRFARFEHADKAFTPSPDIKRLFRHLAQKIHPDRAIDETDRAWRTELMSEANRAYRNSDEMALHDILAQWQEGAPGQDAPQAGERTRQVARLQRRLAEVDAELNTLLASRLYELFIAAKLARADGRDLLQEMASQLEMRIRAAQERQAQLELS